MESWSIRPVKKTREDECCHGSGPTDPPSAPGPAPTGGERAADEDENEDEVEDHCLARKKSDGIDATNLKPCGLE